MMKKRLWTGLSAKLLLLTVVSVMVAEVLIYVPSAARFRLEYLNNLLSDGHLATMALEAAPTGSVSAPLEMTLLQHAHVHSVELRLGTFWTRMLGSTGIPEPEIIVDLRKPGFFELIWDAFGTLAQTENRVLRVIGPSPMNPSVLVEVIADESPLQAALLDYSNRILQLSLFISAITATLVYLALQLLIVRPIGHLTDSMVRFQNQPEDETIDVAASTRKDEIGVATSVLAEMQSTVRTALTQRSHLAALGEAVSKINHDLRNILTSAQLISDRLAKSEDPRVRATSPVLVQAIGRAVNLCSQVVAFSQARRPSLELATEQLYDLLEEAGDNVLEFGETLSQEAVWHWLNDVPGDAAVRCDRRQVLRVFENIARNAFEAGATEVRLDGERRNGRWIIGIADNGPGLPDRAKKNLFQPFKGSARVGGTGLGLSIAKELTVAHGGRLFLDHTSQNGTRFIVELPAAPAGSDKGRFTA
jgi:signal transduction histidine kinase